MKKTGSCHCGKVRYEFVGDIDIDMGIACNCSMCKRKGTLLTFVPAEKFTLLSGEGNLTDYQFGKKAIHHYFCSTCGITSFASGKHPTGGEMRAINLRCVEDLDLANLKIHQHNGADQ